MSVWDRAQRRQFAQVELAWPVRVDFRHLGGAVGQQVAEGHIRGHDRSCPGPASGQVVHVDSDDYTSARRPACVQPPRMPATSLFANRTASATRVADLTVGAAAPSTS